MVERHIADAMAAPHWHDHVELNLLMEGRMTYLLMDGRSRWRPAVWFYSGLQFRIRRLLLPKTRRSYASMFPLSIF